MAARAKKKSSVSRPDATRWRRFLTHSPPLNDLIELRRLQDSKTTLRRRGDPLSVFSTRGFDRRPF